jgi:glycerophosphoryl diester phosphodiesterase
MTIWLNRKRFACSYLLFTLAWATGLFGAEVDLTIDYPRIQMPFFEALGTQRNTLKTLGLEKFEHPLLIGHRGYPARFPENTLASFEGAIRAGCDMIELDVIFTRDRRVVVIHDDTIDRTTNGKGPVKNRTLEEIKRLDAGTWFDQRYSAERVPELSEVMKLVAARCLLNIEIKRSAFEVTYPADAIEHQVVKLVKASGAMDRVIISSFDTRILERIAAMDEPPAIAFISEREADQKVLDMLRRLKAFSWHPKFKILDRDQVDAMHAAGLRVFPWTVNTRKEAEKILSLRVDGLICNELRVMRAL